MRTWSPTANPFRRYADEDGSGFLAALKRSLTEPMIDDITFPRFPPEERQVQVHGHAGESALHGAHCFFRVCQRHANALRGGFGEGARLLDFGSGWGRILRLFMPYFDLDKIVGLEPNENLARIAREANPYVAFFESAVAPPTPFGDATFDFITSWSVFSHLPEALATAWLNEFARITKPGALLLLTTWGAPFLDQLDESAERLARGEETHWYREKLLQRLGDRAEARRRFEGGEFVYIFQSEDYGDTLIPEAALRAMLPPALKLVATDTTSTAQTIFVIEKAA